MKTVLITGSSSGFGRASAKYFQQQGWQVVATMRNTDKAEELNDLDNVLVTQLDVTKTETIQSAIAETQETFGTIDVLVNNAGYGTVGVFEAASDETIRNQFEANVFGLMNVTRAALPHMRQSGNGVIINLSSIAGRVSMPYFSLYNASKYAVEGLSESLQYELAPFGIKLKLIEPGAYATDFGGRSMGFFGHGEMEAYKDTFNHFIENAMSNMTQNPNVDEVVEVIYEAATSDAEKLRYPVGEDANQMLEARAQMNDEAFKHMLAERLGFPVNPA
jgi:NAD(P)-dependent dehydrogenase (short-subunit alcohol dehydrogenase family)